MGFDSRVAVTTPERWAGRAEWASVPVLAGTEFGMVDELVVFSAHADDETLGAGGLLARVAAEGIPVRVVLATGGAYRAEELRSAFLELGTPATVELLGLPDAGLKHEPERLRAEIDDVVAQCSDRCLILAPWPGDRHGDHRTLGREVGEAVRRCGARLLYYPIWLWQWGTPEDVPWTRLVDVSLSDSERRAKAAAIARFTSQLESPSNPDGVLTPDFVQRVSTLAEVLIRPEWASGEAHFEELHRRHDDPWSVRTRWYERRKRALTIAALPDERYARALELGCSIGETTAALAERSEQIIAVDHAPAAVAAASRRLAGVSNATVTRMRIPDDWPLGTFDLIVISELGYYLAEDQWEKTIERCRGALRPGGAVLLCHWLGTSDDFAQTAAEVHEAFRLSSGLTAIVEHRESDFILEVFA
jgi:LmbE family N-acetylglucosaminyl deacetylase/precorrin-6B methylase 2